MAHRQMDTATGPPPSSRSGSIGPEEYPRVEPVSNLRQDDASQGEAGQVAEPAKSAANHGCRMGPRYLGNVSVRY